MENFILYEEIGKGSTSVAYKGRKKGDLDYVAIICTTKAKRSEITNHVRFSLEVRHPNIVSFYEWYETSNHLWLIMELCTGGSLESVISQDGCLSENVVKRFGWNLVKGLKYIHELGIVFAGLNPSKIMLDGSGILKLGNFCLSKAEGETLEDFLSLLSMSVSSEEQESRDDFCSMQKRLEGFSAYSSPEVVQGSDTSISSDLWALGCILYYMFTGKPPFHSNSYSELTEMILYQEPLPPRPTGFLSSPPTEDFQNLLKGLLNKDPDERMAWPELLEHPFWTEVLMEEEDVEEEEEDQEQRNSSEGVGSDNSRQTRTPDLLSLAEAEMLLNNHCAIQQPAHLIPKKLTLSQVSASTPDSQSDRETDFQLSFGDSSCGALRDSEDMDERAGKQEDKEVETKPEAAQQTCHTLQPKNMSELRPKSGVDEENTEAIFLLSSSTNSRRICNISEPPHKTPAPQTSTGIDVTAEVKSLLHTDSDLTVTPVMDNPKILKNPPVRFDQKSLCVPAYSVDKLQSFKDEEWKVFLQQLCSSLKDQNPPAAPSTAALPSAASTRSKLNLLCYLCCVVGHTVVANRLINSVLLSVLTQQLRHAPNWDVKSKALRVMGLLALYCDELKEYSSVSETVSTLSDLLRENLRNSKVKQFLLPPLGDLLYLIASQEEKRGSPEGLWFVPAAAYTGLMRSLREGDDPIVHHMAAKAIENISTRVSGSSHHLVTPEIGFALWYLFTHSTVEAVRVTAISSLSRLTRVVPTVFLAVIDTCGPAAILEGIGGAGARVQQHLLSAMAGALLTSRIHVHRVTHSRDLVLKVQGCLESPSTVTRAKTLLLLLLLLQNNTQTLLFCCQNRLLMYLERDLRKATPLRENPGQFYLCQCMEALTVYLASAAPLILDNILCVLQSVAGRKHPSTAQSRQLKQTLPTMFIVLELVSSPIFKYNIVTADFLAKIGLLLNYINSIESNETNLSSALGSAVCEELIRTSLSIVEVLSQHHAHITPEQNIVVDAILPPLTTLVFSRNVEWSVFVLRVLSEFSLVLLDKISEGTEEDEGAERNKEREEKGGRSAIERDDRSPRNHMLALINKSLLPRYESLLRAAEPIPLYALKLLLSLTEHSPHMCRLIKQRRILPTVLQLIMANSSSVHSGLTQNAVALLCNLSEMEPLRQQGLVEMIVSTLSEAALFYLEGQAGRKVSHLVLQALLELLHTILKQMSAVFLTALQSQRLSCPTVEMEAAENLILENRPLSQLSTLLIHMLSAESQELWDESFQCLSLLVQLYGGEGYDCLTPSCLQSFSCVLYTHMHTESSKTLRSTLRIIKRLVQTSEQPDWFECPEGAELISLLRDISMSNRCHADVVSLATEILHHTSGS